MIKLQVSFPLLFLLTLVSCSTQPTPKPVPNSAKLRDVKNENENLKRHVATGITIENNISLHHDQSRLNQKAIQQKDDIIDQKELQKSHEIRLQNAIDYALNREFGDGVDAGIAVGVANRFAQVQSYKGLANFESGHKVDAQTSFRLASITKIMTALMVKQDIDAGEYTLDTNIRTLYPSFPQKKYEVKVGDLLSHLSGISGYRNCAKECFFKKHYNTKQSIKVFSGWPLSEKPRSKYIYTSYGFNLLGAALESHHQKSFDDLLKERLFKTSDTHHIFVEYTQDRSRDWAQGYYRAGDQLRKSKKVDISSRFAGGGTRGTLPELLNFGKAILDETFVSRRSLFEMWKPQFTNTGAPTDYGLGFASYPYGGIWVVGHAGGQPEVSSLLLMIPQYHSVIAILRNVEGDVKSVGNVARSIMDYLYRNSRPNLKYISADSHRNLQVAAAQRVYSYGKALSGLNAGSWVHDERQDPTQILGLYRETIAHVHPQSCLSEKESLPECMGFRAKLNYLLGQPTGYVIQNLGIGIAANRPSSFDDDNFGHWLVKNHELGLESIELSDEDLRLFESSAPSTCEKSIKVIEAKIGLNNTMIYPSVEKKCEPYLNELLRNDLKTYDKVLSSLSTIEPFTQSLWLHQILNAYRVGREKHAKTQLRRYLEHQKPKYPKLLKRRAKTILSHYGTSKKSRKRFEVRFTTDLAALLGVL